MAVCLGLTLAACAPTPKAPPEPVPPPPAPEGPMTLTPVSFYHLPGWFSDDQAAALPAFLDSCAKLTTRTIHADLGDGRFGTVGDWLGPCKAAERVPAGDTAAARAFFEAWFEPALVSAGGAADGTFTGYYEAELKGSWRRHGPYRTPIYGPPNDLVVVDLGQFGVDGGRLVGKLQGGRLVPYDTRADIAADGAMGGRARPILWVDDPVDAFFLHIQGSGRVVMDDGTVVRVGYAGNNGHKFVGIGSLMLERGLLKPGGASMQSIRDWLRAHPDRAKALMAENPRYIFFAVNRGRGPVGAQGVPLTPKRSLAVDLAHLPLGVPLWLDTTDPDGRPLRRLMVAQDTGKAITGVVRGDFFWGFGEAALAQAGRMKSTGRYFVLIPRVRDVPVARADGRR